MNDSRLGATPWMTDINTFPTLCFFVLCNRHWFNRPPGPVCDISMPSTIAYGKIGPKILQFLPPLTVLGAIWAEFMIPVISL